MDEREIEFLKSEFSKLSIREKEFHEEVNLTLDPLKEVCEGIVSAITAIKSKVDKESGDLVAVAIFSGLLASYADNFDDAVTLGKRVIGHIIKADTQMNKGE